MDFPVSLFAQQATPFYYYNTTLLHRTLKEVTEQADRYGYHVHYAVKANANDKLLSIIKEAGLGADCVSGGEIESALRTGFAPDKIVFAGVGKADWEINVGLDASIYCFNVESIPELEVINELAQKKNLTAQVALRINPDVNAHTHHYITTGLKENKFGIALVQMQEVIDRLATLPHIKLIGLHFHIGSQIMDMSSFTGLCERINEIQDRLDKQHLTVPVINVGGGLGIDYYNPDPNEIPDFKAYFETFNTHLKLRPQQSLHFELGRSIVAQCGSLISRVLYIKEGINKKFMILDAGMTDLIRPALYQAYHKIENISTPQLTPTCAYDVVGPICESSDCFGKSAEMPITKRGDLIAIRSAGAYGEIMASQYNCRRLPGAIFGV